MRCPHCEKHISLFARAVNVHSRRRQCPHCGLSVRLAFRFGRLALLLTGATVLVVLLRNSGALNDAVSTALSPVAMVCALAASMCLRKPT